MSNQSSKKTLLRIATAIVSVLVLVALGMFVHAAVVNARSRIRYRDLSALVVRPTPGPATEAPVTEAPATEAPSAEATMEPEETPEATEAPEPTAEAAEATPEATAEVTPEPTEEAVEATEAPTPEATATAAPAETPTAEPTTEPTTEPTAEPTAEPTTEPTAEPTAEPTPEPTAEPTPEPTPEPVAEPTALADYAALYARNPDFFGWISVPGTNVDYPVMYNHEDPLRYSGHDFDGRFSYAGVPFLEAECDPEGNYYLVYGHHMKDGTMFAGLMAYEDRSFWVDHPTFRFDTREEYRTYAVVAAFRARVLQKEEDGFRYYSYVALDGEETFDEFMTNIRAMAAYDTEVETAFGDDILTLSTCAYHTKKGRFVIVAKRVE